MAAFRCGRRRSLAQVSKVVLDADPIERARAAVDLATVSVLLDAGAGDAWRYREPATGLTFSRSEGLAVASLDMFGAGGFSSDPDRPWRADDVALERIGPESLARYFQVGPDNPLVGLEQRGLLLRRLGSALKNRPDLFGSAPARPGNLIDYFLRTFSGNRIPAATILATLLDGLSSIWPSGLMLRGVPIGDAGRHPAVRTGDDTDQIVPFHKLSQWLTYSLLEPIEHAGLTVTGLDELTALPEYRNGGLLIDLGVICPRQPIDLQRPHKVSSEIVVEWRALTVALMDQLLDAVRRELGLDQHVHDAADAARGNLERRPEDRACAAAAGRPLAAPDPGGWHGVLTGRLAASASAMQYRRRNEHPQPDRDTHRRHRARPRAF